VRQLWHIDPVVRIRAADALEKVSVSRPEVRVGHEREVLEEFATAARVGGAVAAGLLIPRLQPTSRRF
jgi:hypothetical protein